MKLILGDGRLGSELNIQTGWKMFSRKINPQFDFNNLKHHTPDFFKDYDFDNIINCIAYTNTLDNKKDKHWQTNYLAVMDLVELCNKHNKKLIHISSDYIYSGSVPEAREEDVPVHCGNWYSYTKLLSDAYIDAKSNDFLIIRTSFKVNPFMHNEAWVDLVGNFDYVGNIAKLIIELIEKDAKGIYNVGTDLKTIYELAKQTNPDVKATFKKVDHIRPTDVSMNLDKMNNLLKHGK